MWTIKQLNNWKIKQLKGWTIEHQNYWVRSKCVALKIGEHLTFKHWSQQQRFTAI